MSPAGPWFPGGPTGPGGPGGDGAAQHVGRHAGAQAPGHVAPQAA